MLNTSFTPPLHGGASPSGYTPHSFVGFSVHWYVLGISVCYMENISLMLGVWGVPPSVGGFGGISTWSVHMLILVHSCSSLCLMFLLWLQLLLLQFQWSSGLSSVSSVTVAPSLMGLPVTLEQCGVVQPPPLMPRGSGGVIGPASVPQQQPPSSVPLQAYANYAVGYPQVCFSF